MFGIKTCPTCGGDTIRRVRGAWTDEFRGRTYSVPDLEYSACPDCGEKVYDREAMRKIEAHSPPYAKATARSHTGS